MNKETALIFANDLDMIEIFSNSVRAAGYEPVVVESETAGITYLSKKSPTLVVLEEKIVPDGHELAKHLGKDVFIFFMTGNDYSITNKTIGDLYGVDPGQVVVIRKPVTFRDLRDAIGKLTGV